MREIDWSKVPRDMATKMAYDAVRKFCETNPALEAHTYSWYWADMTRDAARVRLPAPVLKKKLDGARIYTRTVVIRPGWEMTGGGAERDRPTTPFKITARIGWNEEHQIAVLFFALGGTLRLESQAWPMVKR